MRSYLFTSNIDFTKQFQDIAASTTSQLTATLLRKAVVCVKKGKMLVFPKRLTKVVTPLMGNLLHILFRLKSKTLLFWATSQDDSNCMLQKSIQNTKQEILSDGLVS